MKKICILLTVLLLATACNTNTAENLYIEPMANANESNYIEIKEVKRTEEYVHTSFAPLRFDSIEEFHSFARSDETARRDNLTSRFVLPQTLFQNLEFDYIDYSESEAISIHYKFPDSEFQILWKTDCTIYKTEGADTTQTLNGVTVQVVLV